MVHLVPGGGGGRSVLLVVVEERIGVAFDVEFAVVRLYVLAFPSFSLRSSSAWSFLLPGLRTWSAFPFEPFLSPVCGFWLQRSGWWITTGVPLFHVSGSGRSV